MIRAVSRLVSLYDRRSIQITGKTHYGGRLLWFIEGIEISASFFESSINHAGLQLSIAGSKPRDKF